MAQQRLETLITINARTGNGFSRVGNTLTEMGALVNGFSQQLIGLGRESVQVYRSYEKSLKSAEVALSTTYGRDTAELAKVMQQLDASATEWAATTIFHTNDVGEAINEAAHAGWDLQEIMYGLPAAMELAQAGGLELSEAVNYIVKATSAAGIGFENLESFTDQWTFASNSSASDIREFGDAMLRMGSTMRFTGSTEELMTLMAVTANAGAVGTEAGTMIRNSMLRLLAPTEKAQKAMAELGATSDETAGLFEDESLAAANAVLAEQGFSAYDQDGKLKNILDIYRQLYVALGDIAGGYESIDRNRDAIQILSAIFPTRTITEALTLLRGAAEGYDGLYEAMRNGAAEGYGEYAAATMMDTLDGKIEIFESKAERLKQLIGDELSGDVIAAADWGGGILDSISEMDPDLFSALVKGGEAIAALGPGLLAAGGALRLIGSLMTPAGAIGAGTVALTALGMGLQDFQNSQIAGNFGTMELDMARIDGYIHSISDGFREAYEESNQFRDAVRAAADAYETASGSLSSKLMSNMLTHAELTPADVREIERLADSMDQALTDAIVNSASASNSYWGTLFAGAGDAYDQAYQQIVSITNDASAEALLEAEGISQSFRSALTSAFADGKISREEYRAILSYMQDYNDAVARAAAEAKSEDDYVKMQMLLHRAQGASWDEVQELITEATTDRDSVLSEQENQYLEERFRLEHRGADKETLDEAEKLYLQQKAQVNAAYDELILNLTETAFQQSDLANDYAYLKELAQGVKNGAIFSDDAFKQMVENLGVNHYSEGADWMALIDPSKAEQIDKAIRPLLNAIGDDQLGDKIRLYTETGNTEMATRLQNLYMMRELLDSSSMYPPSQRLALHADETEAWLSPYHDQRLYAPYEAPEYESSLTQFVDQDASERIAQAIQNGFEIPIGVRLSEEELLAMIDQWEAITEENPVTVKVAGDTSELENEIASYNGTEIGVRFRGMRKFAFGGRATQPSIFGDNGAEWAIPEEHSERTAALLNAARAASGWSWPDLLARFGGVNAKANYVPTTIVYSPTINAKDASGVEGALREDKRRLEKWLEERTMRDAAEVYA